MTWRPLLLPPDIVQVSTVPLTQLRQHSVRKKPMVPEPCHALVADHTQAKGTVPLHATEHNHLLIKGWRLNSKVICPSPFLLVGSLQFLVSARVLGVYIPVQL